MIVDEAIQLSEQFGVGQEAEDEVQYALEQDDRQLAIEKILVAKAAFTTCQNIYQKLMREASSLLRQRKMDDTEDGLELQGP